MTIENDFAGLRLRGDREYQQDHYAFCESGSSAGEPGIVLVVADGAGGMADGAEASRVAVEGFMDAFFSSKTDGSARLLEAAHSANRRVGEACGTPPKTWDDATMASTLVAFHATSEWFEWVSVGDSLLFQVRDAKLFRRNADHSMRQSRNGMAGPTALISALTGAPIPLIEEHRLPWQEGDWLLAASDGLLSLSNEEIAQVFASASSFTASDCVKALADVVTRKAIPRQDNVTITAVRHNGKSAWQG